MAIWLRRRSILATAGLLAAASLGLATGTAGPAAAATAPVTVDPSAVGSTAAVGSTTPDGSVIWSEKWLDGRTVDLQVWTEAVKDFRNVRLLLPKGWKPTSAPTYPLVLALHGGDDDFTSWTRETDIEALSAGWNAIVAMPDAGYSATYTNYYKPLDGKPDQWETFHTVELLQLLQQSFGASKSRGVFGLSAGGYGAMAYATRNPGLFRFAGSFSGPVAINLPFVQTATWASTGDSDLDARFGSPLWNQANWRAHDPLTNADKLRGTSLYLSSGYTGIPSKADTVGWTPIQVVEGYTGYLNATMATKLALLNIKATVDLYPFGEHAWASWQIQMHKSWPQMMTAIGARQV